MNISNYKYIIALLALITSFSLQSCSDDDSYDVRGTTENFVFINTGNWSPIEVSDGIYFTTVDTPYGIFLPETNLSKPEVTFYVQCSQPATADIVVKLEMDNSITLEGYESFPSGVSLAMSKTEVTIPKGAMISGEALTLSVPVEQVALLTPGTSYMASVKITSITGGTLREDYNSFTMFITHDEDDDNLNPNVTGLVGGGTVPDRSAWKGIVKYTDNNGTYYETDMSSTLFDDNANTYFFNRSNYSPSFDLEFDLGSVYSDIKALRLRYYSSSYAIGSANIYISETGTDNYQLLQSVTFSSAAASHYLNFYKKFDARYIKVEVLAPFRTANGTVFADFYAYQ